jgi:hypothetical protein
MELSNYVSILNPLTLIYMSCRCASIPPYVQSLDTRVLHIYSIHSEQQIIKNIASIKAKKTLRGRRMPEALKGPTFIDEISNTTDNSVYNTSHSLNVYSSSVPLCLETSYQQNIVIREWPRSRRNLPWLLSDIPPPNLKHT